jgi:hypothetical protein
MVFFIREIFNDLIGTRALLQNIVPEYLFVDNFKNFGSFPLFLFRLLAAEPVIGFSI